MRSSVVLLALVACEPIERLPLASECGLGNRMDVEIAGHALCAHAERFDDPSRGPQDPGDRVGVMATVIAGDGMQYRLVVGQGAARTRWIDLVPPRRSDKTEIYTGAYAELSIMPMLERPGRGESTQLKGGFVDLVIEPSGALHGNFEVVFEGHTYPAETRRILRATGSFATTAPASSASVE